MTYNLHILHCSVDNHIFCLGFFNSEFLFAGTKWENAAKLGTSSEPHISRFPRLLLYFRFWVIVPGPSVKTSFHFECGSGPTCK